MQTSTIRDFMVIITSFIHQPIMIEQYLRKYKPSSWSKAKTTIYLKILKEFGFIKLNPLISITKTGKEIFESVEKDKIIFINTFFRLIVNYKPINNMLEELKANFIKNPHLSIKKLINKSSQIKKLGIVGQYFISLLLSSFFLYNELPREEKYFELIAKSFINTFTDKKWISFQNLNNIANSFHVNIKNIKVELFRNCKKYYSI